MRSNARVTSHGWHIFFLSGQPASEPSPQAGNDPLRSRSAEARTSPKSGPRKNRNALRACVKREKIHARALPSRSWDRPIECCREGVRTKNRYAALAGSTDTSGYLLAPAETLAPPPNPWNTPHAARQGCRPSSGMGADRLKTGRPFFGLNQLNAHLAAPAKGVRIFRQARWKQRHAAKPCG